MLNILKKLSNEELNDELKKFFSSYHNNFAELSLKGLLDHLTRVTNGRNFETLHRVLEDFILNTHLAASYAQELHLEEPDNIKWDEARKEKTFPARSSYPFRVKYDYF